MVKFRGSSKCSVKQTLKHCKNMQYHIEYKIRPGIDPNKFRN